MKVIYTRKGRKEGRIKLAIERERRIREKKGERKKKKKSVRGGTAVPRPATDFQGNSKRKGGRNEA